MPWRREGESQLDLQEEEFVGKIGRGRPFRSEGMAFAKIL